MDDGDILIVVTGVDGLKNLFERARCIQQRLSGYTQHSGKLPGNNCQLVCIVVPFPISNIR